MAETHSEVKYKEAGKKEASVSLYHRLPETLETRRVREVTELQSESFYSQLPETSETQFAKTVSELQSEAKYKEASRKEASGCLYHQLPVTMETQHAKEASELQSQSKYKEASKKELVNSLYSLLPETKDTQHAKEQSQLHSEKSYKEQYNREKGKSSYSSMGALPEVEHAMEVTRKQSEVSYRRGREELRLYSSGADRPDILHAANATKLASVVSYKSVPQPVHPDVSLLDRTDIQHLKEASKLASQVKYKESFDRDLKGQRPKYNPLDCLSFRHSQAAAALASQVKYRTNQKAEGSSDLPNLLQLEHALHASKLQSNYKKKHKEEKARFHAAAETAEQLHHKENAVLHSQVRYREEYERSRGRCQMEFGDTAAYKVSKEAQRNQSEVKSSLTLVFSGGSIRLLHVSPSLRESTGRDYEEQIKGKAFDGRGPLDTWAACRASSLLSEGEALKHKETLKTKLRYKKKRNRNKKAYRKDLEQEVKGRGLSGVGLEETPELLRVKRASEIQSQQRSYRQTEQLRESCYGTVTDTPELLHASYLKDVYSQKKYRDEAERLKGRRSLIAETAETQRVRANQRHLHYSWDSKLMRGLMSSVTETPELVLARENAKRISDVCYREEVGRGTAVANTPEMERVRRNQDNVSQVKYKQSSVKASSVAVTPELERVRQNQDNISSVKYRRGLQEMKGLSCSEPDTPEYRRARRSQDCVSMVAARYATGGANTSDVAPRTEPEAPLTNADQRRTELVHTVKDFNKKHYLCVFFLLTDQMHPGRRGSCAPPQAKYHEDFERARGRGGTPGLDEPGMERYQRANQMMGEAGYGRGPHPQAMETDRRPGGIIVDLKVWRTDPGSIFDFDPLEDDIQSKSLRRMSGSLTESKR
uniref:Uncharacterized protein n=1 Tax=Gasterosteus aculeatus TaxID=69293 RepID=G3NA44_GASAC